MQRFALATCVCLALAFQLAHAQAFTPQPQRSIAPRNDVSARLPVRRVVLYKNGVGYFDDRMSAALPGATVRVLDAQRRIVAQTATDRNGRYSVAALMAGTYRIEFTLTGFETVAMDLAIEASAETTGNAVMRVAAIHESVAVSGESPAPKRADVGRGAGTGFGTGFGTGVGGGLAGGVIGRLAEAQAPAPLDRAAVDATLQASAPSAVARDLGDLFEYRVSGPISIRRNQSALVPIIRSEINLERVSLWNGRAGARPLRALWLTNSSGLTLDAGSFTVVEDGAFAGEGLLEPLKPQEKRLLSYAVDLRHPDRIASR